MNYWFGRRRREWTVFDTAICVIAVVIMFLMYVFSPKQYVHCMRCLGCRVYNQETMLSPKILGYKFNPQDIKSYEVKSERHYHSRGHSRTSYYPIIELNDGTKIELDTFKLSSHSSVDKFIEEMKTKNNYKKSTPSIAYQFFFN
jgi:hypothetical protein